MTGAETDLLHALQARYPAPAPATAGLFSVEGKEGAWSSVENLGAHDTTTDTHAERLRANLVPGSPSISWLDSSTGEEVGGANERRFSFKKALTREAALHELEEACGKTIEQLVRDTELDAYASVTLLVESCGEKMWHSHNQRTVAQLGRALQQARTRVKIEETGRDAVLEGAQGSRDDDGICLLQYATIAQLRGRLGAFEVYLLLEPAPQLLHPAGATRRKQVLLHSKLSTQRFPHSEAIVAFLSNKLPRVTDYVEHRQTVLQLTEDNNDLRQDMQRSSALCQAVEKRLEHVLAVHKESERDCERMHRVCWHAHKQMSRMLSDLGQLHDCCHSLAKSSVTHGRQEIYPMPAAQSMLKTTTDGYDDDFEEYEEREGNAIADTSEIDSICCKMVATVNQVLKDLYDEKAEGEEDAARRGEDLLRKELAQSVESEKSWKMKCLHAEEENQSLKQSLERLKQDLTKVEQDAQRQSEREHALLQQERSKNADVESALAESRRTVVVLEKEHARVTMEAASASTSAEAAAASEKSTRAELVVLQGIEQERYAELLTLRENERLLMGQQDSYFHALNQCVGQLEKTTAKMTRMQVHIAKLEAAAAEAELDAAHRTAVLTQLVVELQGLALAIDAVSRALTNQKRMTCSQIQDLMSELERLADEWREGHPFYHDATRSDYEDDLFEVDDDVQGGGEGDVEFAQRLRIRGALKASGVPFALVNGDYTRSLAEVYGMPVYVKEGNAAQALWYDSMDRNIGGWRVGPSEKAGTTTGHASVMCGVVSPEMAAKSWNVFTGGDWHVQPGVSLVNLDA